MEKIGYNPYFYSYPQYLSNNLGVNNKFSPNFRGDSVGVASPQTSVNYTTPPDTVEISAGNKINEASNLEKKTGMSTGAKIGLGILGTAAAAYGCVVGHRMINKPSLEKVAKNFSEIFRRDVSKDEAQKMANRYKEIFKLKDDKDFRKELFKQIKKDYGLENTCYDLSIKKLKKGENGHFTPFGECKQVNDVDGTSFYFNSKGCVAVDENWAKSRELFFNTIIHELNHAKQFEIAYRTNSKDALNAYIGNIKDELPFINKLEQKSYDIIAELKKTMKEFLGTTPANSLNKGSKDYELGLKYIENQKNYINPSKDPIKYQKQFVEKESFNVQNLMDNSLNYFLSPWRIF